ncbi:MAG: hypothetical protein J5I91_08080 [Bacteroidetes bacterium]|nr:hypothetical protein [Bacteroidota bacterium]
MVVFKILNMNKNLLLLLVLLLSIQVNSQVDSMNLVSQLNHELFPPGEGKMLLCEYIGKTKDPYIVDSTKLIRKNQPNPEVVLQLLEEIMHTKNSSLIPDIKKIYDRHIGLFWEEWAQVYMENYYPPDLVMSQYTILSGFENVLKSLTIASNNQSHETIFEIYKESLILGFEIYTNVNERCEIMKKYHDFSPLYRELNPCRLFSGTLTFSYKDPFMEDLRPLFIESLQGCNFDSCTLSTMSLPCIIFTQNESFYHSELNEGVTDYYINNFDQLRKCNRYTMAIRYSAKHEDPKLSRLLAYKIVKELSPEELKRYPVIRVFTSNFSNENLNILMRELLDLHQENPIEASNILNLIPTDVLQNFLTEQSKAIDNLIKEISESKNKE